MSTKYYGIWYTEPINSNISINFKTFDENN